MEITLSSPIRDRKIASDGVIGMIFLLATEAMFFAGLISAYIVNRSGSVVWPPYEQPRLPVEITALNSAILIISAIVFFVFSKKIRSGVNTTGQSLQLLAVSILLGSVFVTVQGTEWVKLISYGLTTTSSLYGAFFYLIIGTHALHAVAGLVILLYLYAGLKRSGSAEFSNNKVMVCGMYWYFVVGIWPLLYTLVYLV